MQRPRLLSLPWEVLSEIFKLLPTEDRWRAIAVQLWMTLEQMAQIQQSAALQAQDFAFDLQALQIHHNQS